MAKKAVDTKAPVKSAALSVLVLRDVELALDPTLEDGEDTELNYHVIMTPPRRVEDDLYMFNVEVMIGKSRKDEDKAGTAVKADYFCVIECKNMDDREIENAARRYAQTSAWANFCSLAALMTQQMRAEFPTLPSVAGKVGLKVRDDAEESIGQNGRD